MAKKQAAAEAEDTQAPPKEKADAKEGKKSKEPKEPKVKEEKAKTEKEPKAKEGKLDRTVPVQTSQEQARRFDEMSRQAREAYETYVRIHGKPPPGEEEEVTRTR